MQQASCLEGGPLLWILPLYLHVNKKSDDVDDECLFVGFSDRPLPSTPEHFSTPSHSQDSNQDHDERDTAAKTEATRPPALKSRFSLDDLLQDREKSTV